MPLWNRKTLHAESSTASLQCAAAPPVPAAPAATAARAPSPTAPRRTKPRPSVVPMTEEELRRIHWAAHEVVTETPVHTTDTSNTDLTPDTFGSPREISLHAFTIKCALCLLAVYIAGRVDLGFSFVLVVLSWMLYSARKQFKIWLSTTLTMAEFNARHRNANGGETVIWFNALIGWIITSYQPKLESIIADTLTSTLRSSMPPSVSKCRVKRVTLGDSHPLLKLMSARREGDMMELDAHVLWSAPDAEVGVSLTFQGIPIPVKVGRFFIDGQVHLSLSLQDNAPFLRTVRISFLTEPKIDFKLQPLSSVDIMAVPMLSTWLSDTLDDAISRALVYDSIVIDLTASPDDNVTSPIDTSTGNTTMTGAAGATALLKDDRLLAQRRKGISTTNLLSGLSKKNSAVGCSSSTSLDAVSDQTITTTTRAESQRNNKEAIAMVNVQVVEADEVPQRDNKIYVAVHVGATWRRNRHTPPVRKTPNPGWDTDNVFHMLVRDRDSDMLHIRCYTHHQWSPDRLLGSIQLTVDQMIEMSLECQCGNGGDECESDGTAWVTLDTAVRVRLVLHFQSLDEAAQGEVGDPADFTSSANLYVPTSNVGIPDAFLSDDLVEQQREMQLAASESTISNAACLNATTSTAALATTDSRHSDTDQLVPPVPSSSVLSSLATGRLGGIVRVTVASGDFRGMFGQSRPALRVNVRCDNEEVLKTANVKSATPVWDESADVLVTRLFGTMVRFAIKDASSPASFVADLIGEVCVNLSHLFQESRDVPLRPFRVAGGARGDAVLNLKFAFKPLNLDYLKNTMAAKSDALSPPTRRYNHNKTSPSSRRSATASPFIADSAASSATTEDERGLATADPSVDEHDDIADLPSHEVAHRHGRSSIFQGVRKRFGKKDKNAPEKSCSGTLMIHRGVSTDGTEDVLLVTIVKGTNLVSKDLNGLSDPYVTVRHNGIKVYHTARRLRTLNPEWGEEFHVYVRPLRAHELTFHVKDFDAMKRNESLGVAHLEVDDSIVVDGEPVYYSIPLDGVDHGRLHVALRRVSPSKMLE